MMAHWRSQDPAHGGVDFKFKPTLIDSTTITRLETLPHGSGGFGDVWKCSMSTPSGPCTVAVKCIRVPQADDEELIYTIGRGIRREAYVWITLSHDHILPFLGITMRDDFGRLPALVSPWIENETLSDYLSRRFSQLSDHRKLELIRQVAAGLRYLHEKRSIVHGNLTGTNVLVDASGKLCIADFGLSMILPEADNATFTSMHPGNTRWMAPELFAPYLDLENSEEDSEIQLPSQKPTKAGDIYSFGCVMLQILSGKEPYARIQNPAHVLGAIALGMAPFKADQIDMNESHRQLSSRCLSRGPEGRPSIVEITAIIGHPDGSGKPFVTSDATGEPHEDSDPMCVDDHSGKDRAADEDGQGEEDEFYDLSPLLTPLWGPLGPVREIGGEDIEGCSSRSATTLTSDNQPILTPFNPKYTSFHSQHARLSVSMYPTQYLGPAVDDSDEYTSILRPLMEYTKRDDFNLPGVSAFLSSPSLDVQCAALQLLEHAAEWDSINFAGCMSMTFGPVVELLDSRYSEVRYAALDTLKLFLASPRAIDVVKPMIPRLVDAVLDNLNSPDPVVQLASVELLDAATRSEDILVGFTVVVSRVSSVLPTMPIVTQVIALRVLEVIMGSNTPEFVKAVAGAFQCLSQPLSSPETTVQLAALKVLEAGTRTKDPELTRAVKNILPELMKIQSSGGTDIRNAAKKLLEWGAHNDQFPPANLAHTLRPQI